MSTPEQQNKPDDVIVRLDSRLKNEPNLVFLNQLFAELPELELYLVGGMVRDTILDQKTPKDYDFVSRGVPLLELISALKKYGKVTFNGKNFGVLDFWPANIPGDKKLKQSLQIALPRQEISLGTGGYKDVTTQSDENLPVELDLGRRDLTINAIAYNLRTKEILDPYHGQADLNNNIIRTVGDPEQRFQEDYTRILRAIRFACRFDAQIEDKTWDAIKKLVPRLNEQREVKIVDQLKRRLDMSTDDKDRAFLQRKLQQQRQQNPNEVVKEYVTAREKIGEEILKAFKENPGRALELLDQSGALKLLLPEIAALKGCEQAPKYHSEGDVFHHTKLMLEKLDSPEFARFFPEYKPSGVFALAVLLHDVGKKKTKRVSRGQISFHGHEIAGLNSVEAIAQRFRLDKKMTDMIAFVMREHMFIMTVQDIENVGANKIAERFIDHPFSAELIMLSYLDCVGSVRADGSSSLLNFQRLLNRILEIKKARESQPHKIISGEEVGKILETTKKTQPLIGIALNVIKEFANRGLIRTSQEAIDLLRQNKYLFKKYNTAEIQSLSKADSDTIAEKLISQIKL